MYVNFIELFCYTLWKNCNKKESEEQKDINFDFLEIVDKKYFWHILLLMYIFNKCVLYVAWK